MRKIHGINFLPITAGSVSRQNPDYVQKKLNSVEKRVQSHIWKDILWSSKLYDQSLLSHFYNDKITIFDGETKARTMHWLQPKVLGQLIRGTSK